MPPFGAIDEAYEADFKPGGAWLEADGFSFRHFYGLTLSGPVTRADITPLTDFKIPIFFVLGEMDLTCPPERAKTYFDTINAPKKKIYIAPGTGHNFSWPQLELIRKILFTEVRPNAIETCR